MESPLLQQRREEADYKTLQKKKGWFAASRQELIGADHNPVLREMKGKRSEREYNGQIPPVLLPECLSGV